MSYQKCPICNGVGRVLNTESTNTYEICHVCNGFGIIDELTGLPPYNTNPPTPKSKYDIQKVIENDLEK